MKIKVANCKPSLLPPQQLPVYRFAHQRRTMTRDTQTTPVGGCYKSATLPTIASSQFPAAALEVAVGNLPTAGNHLD